MILHIFPSAKAEVATGVTTAVAGAGFDFAHNVFPIISEIAVVAGCIVACHGVYVIIKDEYLKWKHKKHNQC